jgi:hypothetical protein
MSGLRRIAGDIRNRRHIDVYIVTTMSVALAVLSLVSDLVGEEIRSAVVLAALGLLTYQIALPERSHDLDAVLHSRASFDDTTFNSRLTNASEVWIYGPSAINLLSVDTADYMRKTVLARRDGAVRVMVLDPSDREVVALAARQLDDSTVYPTVDLERALDMTVDKLEMMDTWSVSGDFQYRYLPFNAGFSMVAIDPHLRHGLLIVEFQAFHNESTASRMHLELTRQSSERWYVYWRNQFEHLWNAARTPEIVSSSEPQ